VGDWKVARILRGEDEGTFIEQECVFEHEGRQYEAGGSFIGRHRKSGRLGGLLYVYRTEGRPSHVGSWGGDLKVPARFCREWQSNMGDMRQSVYFEMEDTPFFGVWYKSMNDIVRCREIGGGPDGC
jgi:hypothetical protein